MFIINAYDILLTKREKNGYEVAYTAVSQFFKIICSEGHTQMLIVVVCK